MLLLFQRVTDKENFRNVIEMLKYSSDKEEMYKKLSIVNSQQGTQVFTQINSQGPPQQQGPPQGFNQQGPPQQGNR